MKRLSAVLALASLFAVVPLAAQVQVEVDLSANLFDVVESTTSIEIDISGTGAPGDTLLTGDLRATIPTAIGFGAAILFPATPRVLVGGEFGLFKTTAEGKDATIESDDWYFDIPAGDADIQILRFGPVVRFLLPSSDPKLQPFIQGGVAYAPLTLDIQDAPETFKEGLLDISASAGVAYWAGAKFYIGGSARLDYYLNIKESSVEDLVDYGDVFKTKTKWSAVSLLFHVGFLP